VGICESTNTKSKTIDIKINTNRGTQKTNSTDKTATTKSTTISFDPNLIVSKK